MVPRRRGANAKNMVPKPSNLAAMAGHHSDGDMAWKIKKGKGPMPGCKALDIMLRYTDFDNPSANADLQEYNLNLLYKFSGYFRRWGRKLGPPYFTKDLPSLPIFQFWSMKTTQTMPPI